MKRVTPRVWSPFIDRDYFDFAYGDTDAGGERIIDSQMASSNLYVYGTISGQEPTLFGVNDFADNGDGTVTDSATGLMWSQTDSGEGMNWEAALAFAQNANAESYLGYSDCLASRNCKGSWATHAPLTQRTAPRLIRPLRALRSQMRQVRTTIQRSGSSKLSQSRFR